MFSVGVVFDDEIFIKLKLPNAYTFIINKSYTGLHVGLHMESSCQMVEFIKILWLEFLRNRLITQE